MAMREAMDKSDYGGCAGARLFASNVNDDLRISTALGYDLILLVLRWNVFKELWMHFDIGWLLFRLGHQYRIQGMV